MALKVAIAAGGAAKAMLKPTLLCRPWEVLAAHVAPRRSISSVSTCLGCMLVYEHMHVGESCGHIFPRVHKCVCVCVYEHNACV